MVAFNKIEIAQVVEEEKFEISTQCSSDSDDLKIIAKAPKRKNKPLLAAKQSVAEFSYADEIVAQIKRANEMKIVCNDNEV